MKKEHKLNSSIEYKEPKNSPENPEEYVRDETFVIYTQIRSRRIIQTDNINHVTL